MIGAYYSSGIRVKPYLQFGQYIWHVFCKFNDCGSQLLASSEGVVQNRYSHPDLSAAIDNVKRDVEALGINWQEPTIYMNIDGQDKETAYPDNWRELVAEQCLRLGWNCLYV